MTEETTEPLTEPEETTGSTTEPVTEAEPDGTQDEESSSPIVSESDPVENSWFDDAVFIGDSRVEGFRNQSGLTNAQYLAGKGMNVKSVFTEDYIRQGENKVTVLEALDEAEHPACLVLVSLCASPRASTFPWVRPRRRHPYRRH